MLCREDLSFQASYYDDFRVSPFKLPLFKANIPSTSNSDLSAAILTPQLLKPVFYSQEFAKDYSEDECESDPEQPSGDEDDQQVIHVDMSIFS